MSYIKNNIDKKQVLASYLEKNNVEAIILYCEYNRLWFSKFYSTHGYILFTNQHSTLYLDGRYITDGSKKAQNVDEVTLLSSVGEEHYIKKMNKVLAQQNVKKIGFESNYLTFQHYLALKKTFPDYELVPIDFTDLRIIKDNEEISYIHKAGQIGDKAIANVIKTIKPGMSERDVEQIIVDTFINEGAEKPSFDTIVASGYRGAFPHGRASDKIIANNELVTIDFGCIYKGYCSDTTRTIGLGQPDQKLVEIHNIVKEAQWLGIQAVRPGITGAEIDKICRDYIEQKGYGQYFVHGTGHGVGIEVHENPYVASIGKEKLEPGMVITVEPGIYIPDLGGVRIEDDILVTDEGFELLTNAPRDLILV